MSVVVLVLLGLLTFFLYKSWQSTRKSSLPPGPGRLPIIGSVHRLPFGYQQHAFLDWKKTYGDIIYLEIFNKPAVVLNSAKVMQELLDKRGSKYSGRPRSVLISEMIGMTNNVTILPYGDQWRRQRRWFQTAFQSASALESYVPLQRCESVRLLSGILDAWQSTQDKASRDVGKEVFSGVKRYVGALMMQIAYGHSVASLDDEFVVLSERALAGTLEAATSVASLVDFFPFLRYLPPWLPGAGFLTKVAEVHELVRVMIDVPYERVQASIAKGAARPCFLTSLLDEYAKDGKMSAYDEADVKGAANIVYGAGTDTTATVLTAFLLAIVLHPEALKKAQAEIDSVVGTERLPELGDRQSLPYFDVLLKEVYRWHPPVPLVIPRLVTEEDTYRSYTIPAGSVVMPNIWAITRDPECYPDADAFRPERFLSSTPEPDPRGFAFGFGRRSCPGQAFGDSSVWLAAARIVAAFDVTKAHDPATGAEVSFQPKFASGMISHVMPFPFEVQPRSERVGRLIRELETEA
ncbi:cytochrome P450 monooxygenase [Rhodofomes roseus]|uniref:Cytochrome P450 monooxygenase n=1 Tax=Rhodofomes roseus TaxID=34475 RepID=A0ABQ8KJ41_9APHY|nr:cytochrome P450 monooxygenase [Rhodofomes roseus]KAH9837533.1 cytochrome P450 monooxygenase [Rhodofomes roseus]